MKNKILYCLTVCLLAVAACKKQDITIPPALAQFTATGNTASYYVQNDPNSVFKIPVGFTTASNADRVVSYTVTSPTGAAAGTQYEILSSGSLVIPAGKVVDSIQVKGLFAGIPPGRVDTLVFRLTGGDGAPASWSNTFNLVMQRYCNVDLAAFSGTYIAQDYDAETNQPDGAPYTVTLTPGTATGNTGTLQLSGLWGVPVPFNVTLNWSNPAAFTTNIPDQAWFVDATYGQARIKADGSGNFSSCENTMTIRYDVYVSLGSFGQYYTTLRK